MMIVDHCRRADHPTDPHYHSGYGGSCWSREYPHWDPYYTDGRRYARAEWHSAQVHPDMDYDAGWRS